jgi:2-aminoadipate transaminase
MTMQWRNLMARRTERMSSSIIREILKFAQQPDIISLAGGWPAAGLFPSEELAAICCDVLTGESEAALQYGVTEGYTPLRRLLAEAARARGMQATEGNVVITSGSQQALDLAGRVLIDAGDAVLVERPTYLGMLQAWGAYGARFVTVPLDDDGMCVAAAEEAIRREHVKLVYAMPNFHNPAGVTLCRQRRLQLLELAHRYGLAVIEDDPYGELRYEGEPLPSLYALDASLAGEGDERCVIYTSTFSKTLAPGMRLGWVFAPPGVARQLVLAKQGTDLHTNTFCQVVAYEYARRGLLEPHVEEIRATYRKRRDAMLAALAAHMPPGVRWTRPAGGLFLWLMLPEGVDSVKLLDDACAQKVAFVPGPAFHADGSGRNAMRLTFASSTPEVIEEGVRRLAGVLRNAIEVVGE